ncbi:Dynamin superfamily [Trema orientale]|uniref:Dynamin superfamily n=1 Tax=Trema orientale TaxID=63057 RepID=A0A2P5D7A4_TREOI|nr:Dynamin superfamily [Trema orientale]
MEFATVTTRNPRYHDYDGSCKIVNLDDSNELPRVAPIFSSYNDRIRPVLDAIDKLRSLAKHSELSKIDKSIVGIPVLAQKLMQIQAKSIARNFPGIVEKINDKLNQNLAEFKKLPKAMASVAEAITAFMRIIGLVKESTRKVLLRGEYDEYPDEKNMHCKARLVEMLNGFSDELHNCPQSDQARNFLMDEIKHLEEAKEISLPNFLPRTAFLSILKEKVNGISRISIDFVEKLWAYIEEVLITVLMSHVEDYHQLQLSTRRAGVNLIEKTKEKSMTWVLEVLEMEKLTDYTCNPEYESEWERLMAQKDSFMSYVNRYYPINIEGFGSVDSAYARQFPHLSHQAYDLSMRMAAYWKIVLRRLVDSMALHLQLRVHELVNQELEKEIVSELMTSSGNGFERLMEESPSVATKRVKLAGSINKLKECKEILATIMDRITTSSSRDRQY